MRRSSLRAIAIVAALTGGVLGTTIDIGQARQVRGTVGVTVRVVAACSATLGQSPGATVAACPSASAPLIVATETAAPTGTPATESTTATDSVHYVTLIY